MRNLLCAKFMYEFLFYERMKGLLKIFLLLFAVQLSLNSVGYTGSSYEWSAKHSTGNSQHPAGYPAGHSNLYVIHHQAENSAEITNRVPQLQPTTERKYEPFSSSAPESVLERRLIFYTRFSDLIEPGLTIRKLIFPFHFFF